MNYVMCMVLHVVLRYWLRGKFKLLRSHHHLFNFDVPDFCLFRQQGRLRNCIELYYFGDIFGFLRSWNFYFYFWSYIELEQSNRDNPSMSIKF